MRAINERRRRRIFCLVHAEKLSYQVADQALRSFTKHSQGKKGIGPVCVKKNENGGLLLLAIKLSLTYFR